jgi:hypothetical protein
MASWRPCHLSIGGDSVTISTSGARTVEGRTRCRVESRLAHRVPNAPIHRAATLDLAGYPQARRRVTSHRRLEDGRTREDWRWCWPKRGDTGPERDVTNLLHSSAENACGDSRAWRPSKWSVDSSLPSALARVARPDTHILDEFLVRESRGRRDQLELSMARHLPPSHEVHNTTPEQCLTGWLESIHVTAEPVHHIQSGLLHLLFRDCPAAAYDARHGFRLTRAGGPSRVVSAGLLAAPG